MTGRHDIMTTTSISNEGTWSGEDRIFDYLSISGLNTKFGLNGKDYDIFIIQQTLDNAVDFIEQNSKKFVNEQNPYVSVIITEEAENQNEEEGGKVTKIQIRNSNAGINNLFSEERINKIFKFDTYQSSKRYRHKINRGELGDAFKAILGIPYAIDIYPQYKKDIDESIADILDRIQNNPNVDYIESNQVFEIK